MLALASNSSLWPLLSIHIFRSVQVINNDDARDILVSRIRRRERASVTNEGGVHKRLDAMILKFIKKVLPVHYFCLFVIYSTIIKG